MTTAEVIAVLAKAGCVGVSEWRVGRAIRLGHIPKPEMASDLTYRWSAVDVAAAMSWFSANPVRKYRRRVVAAATAGA